MGISKIKKMNFSKENMKYIFLALSLIFIGMGVFREEHLVVLQKAVNICLECIGVG